MFEEVLLVTFLFSIFLFKITAVMAVSADMGKHSSFSEKKDERFMMFCESLKHEKKSLLVDKKADDNTA